MTKAHPASSTAAVDPQLAQLIDDITAKLQNGQQVDVSAILHSHPDYADELREILPTLAALGDLSQSAQNGLINSPFGQDDTTGTLGDFRLVRELGRGGMGVVYEALQISLNRRVALKVLPFAATMDPKHLQRFRNEAMAAASLRHENIVHVYGVGCERSVHFYAMEMIDGQTLAQIIAALNHQPKRSDVTSDYQPASAAAPTAPVGALSTEFSGIKGRELHRLAARLIADAADALEHAHSLGIVHRDIKPGNLMVDPAGKIYVTDFGLARFGPDAGLTMSGDLLGTLRYMSPEQAMARHGLVDHRTDVYSLGATLYELVTGRPAVVGEDKQQVLKHIAFEDPTPLRKIDKSIPVELETITLKALAKNPNERYATAKALAEDLRRFCADKAIRAKPPTGAQKITKWIRRHRPLVWSAATIAVGLLAIAVVALSLSNQVISRERDEKQDALRDKEAALVEARANFAKAESERKRAEKYFLNARIAIGKTVGIFSGAGNEWRQVPVSLQKKFAEQTISFYQQFQKDGHTDPELRFETGWAYWQIGILKGRIWRDPIEAEKAYRQAVAVLEPLASEYPTVAKYRQHLGMTRRLLGQLLAKRRPDVAEDVLRQAADDYEIYALKLGGSELNEWFVACIALAEFLMDNGRAHDADQVINLTLARGIRLFEEVGASSPNRIKFAHGFIVFGNDLMRIGQLNLAETAFRHAAEFDPPLALANLGYCLRMRGKFKESLAAFQRSHELCGSILDRSNGSLEQWIDKGKLLVELEPRLPAIVASTAQPDTPAQAITVAEMCHIKRHYATAARLYAEAFAAEPKLAANLQAANQYNAACAAALAGCSQGEDAKELDEAERSRLRRQALNWLTSDVAAKAKLTENAADRAKLQTRMQHWQKDPDLAGVRNAASVAKLPEAERAAWQRLWADVAELLKRCEESL
jgi:serine/threonine protein kinase